jgi:hypothetical protein
MGQSFKTYKNQILLEDLFNEIFDTPSFKSNFEFSPSFNGIETKFGDLDNNKIKIYFYSLDNNLYELDFTVEGTSYQYEKVKYSLKDYTSLLATVAEATSQFLKEYKPLGLKIEGTNIFSKIERDPKFEGQKNRIYKYFINKIEDTGEYMVDKEQESLNIISLVRK